MNKEKVIPVWLGILNLILIVCGIVWTVLSMFTAVPPDGHFLESKAIHALMLLPMIGALLYGVTGYKKSSALFFNIVVYIYVAVMFITALLVRNGPVFLSALSIISFGILCVLAIAKDLGQKKSLLLCGLNAVIALIRIIAYIIATGQFPGGMFGNLMLACVFDIMVYAKYADKTARSTV